MTRATWLLITLSLSLVLIAGAALAADDTLEWGTTWQDAQTASRASGKCVLAYIYQPRQAACVEMDKTFTSEAVVKTINQFVPLALNGSSSANRAFCAKYGVGVRSNADKGLDMDFAATPAYLFLDGTGKEYYRTFGFYPAALFVEMLDHVSRLVTDLNALAQRPTDAVLNADLGQQYLYLEHTDLGKPYLEKAVKLDPENTTGARADAELNLAIISIPENPDLAFRQLIAYQFNNPESKRGLELRYYMAVAELANEHRDKAKRILLDFQSIPPNAVNGKPTNPDYTKWTVVDLTDVAAA
ncbi:MAG: hypothetical protein WCP21_15560, partial [Armatimonadota bacterium]